VSLAAQVEALQQIPLFAKVELGQLRLLAFTAQRISYQPGQTIFCQNDTADAAYVILDGEAAIEVMTPSGPLVVATVGRNGFVGEIGILCDVPRTASVRATTVLETLCISKDLFFRLVMEFPQMGVEIMRELASRLDKTTRELSALRRN
jgi:CRP/FNR family transcriptional regulator, cyclic AMP receptor protein